MPFQRSRMVAWWRSPCRYRFRIRVPALFSGKPTLRIHGGFGHSNELKWGMLWWTGVLREVLFRPLSENHCPRIVQKVTAFYPWPDSQTTFSRATMGARPRHEPSLWRGRCPGPEISSEKRQSRTWILRRAMLIAPVLTNWNP